MKTLRKFCKKNYLIITILILAFFLRALYFDDSYIFWDESIYLMGGKALTGQEAGYTELDFRSPLLPILITPFTLFSNYVFLSKAFMILINSTLIILIYIFGKQFNKAIGLLSAFLAAILPHHLMSSSWVMTDGPTAILLLTTILLYFKGFKQNKNKLLYLGGFFLSLAILMKFTNLLLLILLLPLIIFNFKKIKTVLKSFLIALLAFSPYLIINYYYFGNPVHGILKAFRIGNTMLEIIGVQSLSIIIKVFTDFFGISLSILIFVGFFLFIKKEIISQKNKKIKRENFFWTYCFLIFLPYYIYLVHEGATPIWWDPQRFLLSFLPFGLLFSTYFITKIINISNKPKWALTFLIVLILLSWSQQYTRFIQQGISYEDGLRHATKEIGLYLKDENINNILCIGNCPPIAYYSNKKISIMYNIKDLEQNPEQYAIIFSDNIKKLKLSYETIKTTCKEKWCAYLIKKKINNFKYEGISKSNIG